MTPEEIDRWRWEQAQPADYNPFSMAHQHDRAANYRHLVREDIRPPAEPGGQGPCAQTSVCDEINGDGA